MAHLRSSVTSFGRAMNVGVKVWHGVKHLVPDSRIKDAASKGVTTYEGVVEKLRAGGL